MRRSTTLLLATLTASSSVLALSNAAVAQDDSDGFGLDTVVVTARRVEENLQKTPVAVSAFTADGLVDRQIDSTDGLSRATPNLQFSTQSPASANNASSQIFIRGIGQTDFLPSTDPGVGIYVDGVYLPRSVGATMDFVDVERVEVLKGPQGTLFGRNTIGGAINIVTAKPADEFGGRAFVKVGSFDRVDTFGTVSIPLTDNLFSKVTFGTRDREGYVERLQTGELLGDDNKRNVRGQFRWLANPSTEFNLSLDYVNQDENGAPLVFNRLNPNQAFFNIAGGTPACDAAGAPGNRDPSCTDEFNAGPFANNGTFPVFSTFELFAATLESDFDLGWGELKSITGYRDNEWSGSRDADNTPLKILETVVVDQSWQFSQELQLSGSSFENKLEWLVGAYYFTEENDNDYFVGTAPGDFSLDGEYENSTYAGFANLTYSVTDRFRVSGGLRVFEETKKFLPMQETLSTYAVATPVACSPLSTLSDPADPLFNAGCVADPAPPAIVLPAGVPLLPEGEIERDYSDVTFEVSLSYDVTDDILAYAKYSEGFKGGGFNGRNIFPLREVPEFIEEQAQAFELGFKSTLFDNTLRLNAAGFYTTYEDIQIVLRQDFAPININAGEATVKGFEAEAEFVPTSNFLLQASVGFVDGDYDELSALAIANGVTIDNELPFSPQWTASLGGAYTIDLDEKGQVTPRVDWSYQTEMFFDAVNTAEMAQDPFSLLSASLTYEPPQGAWRIMFAGTNLTDEEYRIAGFTSFNQAAAYEEVAFGRPREWSLTVFVDF